MPSDSLPAQRIAHVHHIGFADPQIGAARRRDHADLVDGWLRGLWDAAGAPDGGAALAAIGSLGRRDLGPVSDIDLLLLVDREKITEEDATALASALWYPIWDSGTSLDHAVRSVEDCEDVAREDLLTAISLLDLRLIAGDESLVEKASARVRAQWRREARRRTVELTELVEDRGGRYGQLAYSTEPNLKSDRGGLRDVTLIRAFAESWLADHDHTVVDRAADVLADARDALHAVTGRASTRLGRADQDAVAALTGHATADDHLAELADAARAVAWELHLTVRAARAAVAPGGAATRGRGTDRRPALQRLEHGVVVHSGEVSVDPSSPDPLRDLAAVAHSAATGMPLSEATLARIATAPVETFTPAQRDLLIDALAGPHIASAYEALDVKGIVAQWVPGWDAIRNRPQRSAVHRFTVDRHQIETVREAQAFLGRVDRPDLLLLAALLHDMGKTVDARDHSLEGAPIAEAAALHLGFSAEDAAIVRRLVREHLTLVELATGRDLADPVTLQALLKAVGHDARTLELLRALTEADARAAGPAAWSSWRASLVDHLTGLARAALAGRAPAPRHLLVPQKSAHDEVLRVVREGAAAHVIYPAAGGPEPITQICMGAPDGAGVFAAMARVLARHRLSVRSALATTVDGIAVDTWWVSGSQKDLPPPTALRSALERELERRDSVAARVLEVEPPPTPRTAADTPVVTLLPGASADATVVQVNAPNRPSLLADIAETVTLHRLLISRAHVMTLGGRAVDVLYLTDARGRALDAPEVGRLIASLMEAAAV